MKANEDKFRAKAQEYMDFVKTNTRFPKNMDKFSDGTSMTGWRRWATENRKDEIIINFDQGMKDLVIAQNKINMEKAKDQAFYDKITSPRCPGSPDTLKEYLEGDNRYIYFDIEIYSKVMKYIGESSDLLSFLKLIDGIWGPIPWIYFHQRYNIYTIKDQLYDLLMNKENSGNVFNDKQIQVLCYSYGLFDYEKKTLDEIGLMFNVSRERIRQLLAKILRMLRHPSRSRLLKRYPTAASRKNAPVCNKIGHWFVVWIEGTPTAIKRPSFELEEVLMDMNIDPSDPDSDRVIKSVKTRESFPSEIEYNVITQMDIDAKGVFEDRIIYEYTNVVITQLPKRKTFEESLEDTLEQLRRAAIRERINREMDEERSRNYEKSRARVREREIALLRKEKELEETKNSFKNGISRNAQFVYSFTRKVYNIVDSINFTDDDDSWETTFNDLIDGFVIPYDLRQKTADIIGEALNSKLSGFNITCIFMVYDDYGAMVQIKSNSKITVITPKSGVFDDSLDEFSRRLYKSAGNILTGMPIDDKYGWLTFFNIRISGFLIKLTECKTATNVIQYLLNDILDSFNLICHFDKCNETYVTLRLTVASETMNDVDDCYYHFNIQKRSESDGDKEKE